MSENLGQNQKTTVKPAAPASDQPLTQPSTPAVAPAPPWVAAEKKEQFDPARRWVRVTRVRDNGLVEFDFSVGEPELYIELVLPMKSFEKFCAHNHVEQLTPEQEAAVDYDRAKWRYGKPGIEE